MRPKRHPLDGFIHHPALCHLAPGATIPSIVEASVRRLDGDPSCSRDDEQRKGIAAPLFRASGARVADGRAALHLLLPGIRIWKTYRDVVRKAVILVTGAFVRPHGPVSAAAVITSPSQKR